MQDFAIAIIFVGVVVFAAHLFDAIFQRTGVPDVLLLVIIGLVIGPLLGIITPSHFGILGPIFTVITFIIILFVAGIELNISAIRQTFSEAVILTFCVFCISVTGVATATYFLTDLGLIKSLMLGTIVGGTSSSIVAPLIGRLSLKPGSKSLLLLESTITDVLCILGTMSLIELLQLENLNVGVLIGRVISSFVLAAILGILSAVFWSFLLNKIHTLQNSIFTTAAFVFVIFGVAEWLAYSGAVATLAFGITLGNTRLLSPLANRKYISSTPIGLNHTEKIFFNEVVFLLKTFFFLYIGISLRLTDWWIIALGAIMTVIIFILRLPVVRLTLSKDTHVSDAALVAVMAPRGLAAAVLAAIPLQREIEGGELIQNSAYAVILFSIVIVSVLVFLIEKTKFVNLYKACFRGFSTQNTIDQEPANT